MGSTFPGITRSPWYTREWIATLVGGVPPFIGATVALLKEEKVPTRYWLAGSVVWLALAMVQRFAQALHKDRKQAAYESAADLTGCLHVLVGIIRAKLKIPDTEMDPLTAGAGKLRTTVYKLEGQELEQCVPYAGGVGGPHGRRISIRTGVVGQAARSGKPVVAKRRYSDAQKYIEELVGEWNFTQEEAEQVAKDRWSWMAVPVRGTDSTIAVIFLDSNEAAFFTEDVQQYVLGACTGLASYIHLRYNL